MTHSFILRGEGRGSLGFVFGSDWIGSVCREVGGTRQSFPGEDVCLEIVSLRQGCVHGIIAERKMVRRLVSQHGFPDRLRRARGITGLLSDRCVVSTTCLARCRLLIFNGRGDLVRRSCPLRPERAWLDGQDVDPEWGDFFSERIRQAFHGKFGRAVVAHAGVAHQAAD